MLNPDALLQYQTITNIIEHKPAADRAKVEACIRRIDQEVTDNGDLGLLALAMVGILKQINIDD